MTDIVERLRVPALRGMLIAQEAADEIERLRASERSAWNAAVVLYVEIERLRDEIGRLRDENARAEKTLHRMGYLRCEHCGGWHRTLGTQLCGKEKA